jgi:signal peptidase I
VELESSTGTHPDRGQLTATALVPWDHIRCFVDALSETLTRMGYPSSSLDINSSLALAQSHPPSGLALVDVEVRMPGLDQATLERAVRETVPACRTSKDRPDAQQFCLTSGAIQERDGQQTIFAPLPLRQDQTILAPFAPRQDQTILAPLVAPEDVLAGPVAPDAVFAPPVAPEDVPEPCTDLPTATEVEAESEVTAPAPVRLEAGPVRSPRHRAMELLQVGLILIGIFLGFRLIMQTFRVDGPSMAPNFESGQTLVVNKVAYWHIEGTPFEGLLPGHAQGSITYLFDGPRRGDVVVLRPPKASNFDADLIKRIIGLPGDVVSIHDGSVFVNGNRLDESYVQFPADYTYPGEGLAILVPDDSYFVLGDNRPVSADSHLGWLVSVQKLVGQAWLSYWPIPRWGFVSHGGVREGSP